jgi:hypothetical protein
MSSATSKGLLACESDWVAVRAIRIAPTWLAAGGWSKAIPIAYEVAAGALLGQ